MKKIIGSIVAALVLGLLAVLGVNIFGNSGPRERIKISSGERVIVEELSWYSHGDKIYGRLFKPADEKGNWADSMGTRPVLMVFHDPLKPTFAESTVKAIVPQGVIGYMVECPAKPKDLVYIIKKMSKESFTSEGMIFVLADRNSSDAAVEAVSRIGSKIAGLILVDPALQGMSAITVKKNAADILTVSAEQKKDLYTLLTDYMEERGAFK